MKKIKTLVGVVVITMVAFASWAAAADLRDITLPTPRIGGGKLLMQALKERQSARVFSTKKLPAQVVSDLLWAAFGINRPDSGKRTAPSAMNWQEVDVYVIMEDAAYLYDAKANSLKGVAKGDLRKLTGTQAFVITAPLNLVYVADITRMKGAGPEDQALYSGADVGFISQNVYLFCASEGLATVVRGSVDRGTLAKALNLPENKRIILAQTVGYPGTDSR
jgi:nitroreductase